MNIYEIKEEYLELLEEWNNSEGGSEEEGLLEEALSRVTADLDTKVDSMLSYLKALRAESEAIKMEESKLRKRRATLENKSTHLKGLLATILDDKKWKNEKHVVSYRKSESVNVFNPECLPESYCNVSFTPNKTLIKEALKDGCAIPGAILMIKNNIIIK